MKYIGIRGHRGSGKATMAYLLANTIEYLSSKRDMDEYKDNFDAWCTYVIDDEEIIYNTNCDHVIIESFGDGPKTFIYMLTGIPMCYLNSDFYKDNIVINLKTFEHKEINDDIQLITAKDYFKNFKLSQEPEVISGDVWMTLREFIQYFGIYIMQNAFGLNVWIKSLNANSEYYNCLYPDDFNGYKIYCDVKAKSEVTYIKEHDGVIIKVNRPNHKKLGGMALLAGDNRYDYEITNPDNLQDAADQVLDIAKKIMNIKDK